MDGADPDNDLDFMVDDPQLEDASTARSKTRSGSSPVGHPLTHVSTLRISAFC
jgi:hypothetical protein